MSSSPFRTIWTSPRETVRRIIAEDPRRHVILLACLVGIGSSLDSASTRAAGDHLPIVAIFGLAFFLGSLGGLVTLWIASHLVRWTGTWIGGPGSREHLTTAIAWGWVPMAFALLLWIPLLLLFGSEMFIEEMPRMEAQPLLLIPLLVIGSVQVVLSIWSIVLLAHTVAEVQGFRSAWRGLANMLLASGVIFIPLALLVFIVVAGTRP